MSGRKRFFIEKLQGDVSEVYLEGEEFIHAKTVLRVEEGAEIILLDGSGKEYSAIVAKIEKHRLLAHITGSIDGDREPQTEIYLLCGALKGDKTELVVQKATELGVTKIGVFASEYCSAFMNGNKIERLKKVARESAKQCMRSRVPEIEYFNDLVGALKSADGYDNKLFACEFLESGSGFDLSRISGYTVAVVGSEGGFSQKEYKLATASGFAGVSLGKRILRAETAAISMCALVAYALGELK